MSLRPARPAAVAALFGVLLSADPASAGLTVYATRATFDANTTGQSIEDFGAAQNVPEVVAGPISSATGNTGLLFNLGATVFEPGDIIPNLVINADGPDLNTYPNTFFVDNSGDRLPLGNNPLLGTAPVALTTDRAENFARFDFDVAPVTAFALDLGTTRDVGVDPFSPAGEYTVRVYGVGNVLLDTKTVSFTALFDVNNDPIPTSVFFGFTSTDDVYRVEVENVQNETFSNVTLGSANTMSAVPGPGVLALALSAGPPGLLVLRRWGRQGGRC